MVAKKDETYIDPQFFLPPGVYDFQYIDKDDISDGEEGATEFSEFDTVSDELTQTADEAFVADVSPESDSPLPIPEGLTIVSQSVKAAAGGGYLVDIIVDIPDMHGVENFDVAVTKA